jgi:hypothetical protein
LNLLRSFTGTSVEAPELRPIEPLREDAPEVAERLAGKAREIEATASKDAAARSADREGRGAAHLPARRVA